MKTIVKIMKVFEIYLQLIQYWKVLAGTIIGTRTRDSDCPEQCFVLLFTKIRWFVNTLRWFVSHMVSQRYDNLVTSNTGSKIVTMVHCTMYIPPQDNRGAAAAWRGAHCYWVCGDTAGQPRWELILNTETKFYSLTVHVVLRNIQTCNNFFKTQQKNR